MANAGLCRWGNQEMPRREQVWIDVGARRRTQGFEDTAAHAYNPYIQESEAGGLITSSKAV